MTDTIKVVPTVPPRELEICKRVREIRLEKGWKQSAFAKALGLPRVRLASYEYGRAPVRYELAKLIGEKFGVSQRWLAEGLSPEKAYVTLPAQLESQLDGRMLFSAAYENVVRPYLLRRLAEAASVLGCRVEELSPNFITWALSSPEPDASANVASWKISNECTRAFTRTPPNLRRAFLDHLLTAMRQFKSKHKTAIAAYTKTRDAAVVAMLKKIED